VSPAVPRRADLEVSVDRAACRGSRECVRLAPRAFALDAERRATVRDAAAEPEAALLAAARACPRFAIQVHRASHRLA
jgi:ferredoxin